MIAPGADGGPPRDERVYGWVIALNIAEVLFAGGVQSDRLAERFRLRQRPSRR
jgi:hypothetical protein